MEKVRQVIGLAHCHKLGKNVIFGLSLSSWQVTLSLKYVREGKARKVYFLFGGVWG